MCIRDRLKVPVLGKMPIDMDYATKADGGFFAAIDNQYITDVYKRQDISVLIKVNLMICRSVYLQLMLSIHR